MNLKTKVFSLAIYLLFPGLIFSQEFSRVLEVRPSRMNGQDIVNLQGRLIALGFNEIGDADGFYGPRTEQAIKTIQKFSGFEENGQVDRQLWNFIFSNEEIKMRFLSLINSVSRHDKNAMDGIRGRMQYEYWGYFGYDYTIYYSSDGIIRILEINGGTGDFAYSEEIFFVDFDRYIIVHNRGNVLGESNRGIYLRNRDFAHSIHQGEIDNNASFELNANVLLGILHSLRFR